GPLARAPPRAAKQSFFIEHSLVLLQRFPATSCGGAWEGNPSARCLFRFRTCIKTPRFNVGTERRARDRLCRFGNGSGAKQPAENLRMESIFRRDHVRSKVRAAIVSISDCARQKQSNHAASA